MVRAVFRTAFWWALLLLGSCSSDYDCEEADAKATALLVEFGSCSAGQRCEVVPLGPSLENASTGGICIQAFLCTTALREGAGQEAFIARAREIVRRRNCTTCVAAKCGAPELLEAFCDTSTNQCRLRTKTM
jgi:hypothetical protein